MLFPKPAKKVLSFWAIVPLLYFLSVVTNGFSRVVFLGYTLDISTVGFILLGFTYLYLVSVLFCDKVSIFYAYLSFLVSSLFLAVFVISRMIFGADFLSFKIFTSLANTPVGSFNNLGIFFGIGAILSLITYQIANVSKFIKWVMVFLLFLSLFFIAIANFGIIWFILGATAFLFIFYSMFDGESYGYTNTFFSKVKRIPFYPSIVFIISLTFIIWGSTPGAYLSQKFGVTNLEVRPDFATTLEIAKQTIKEKPFFGSGPNTFVNQWLVYRPDEIITSVFWNTDFTNGIGLMPTFAVTTGVLGVLSWLLFLGYYVYLGIKSLFRRAEDNFVMYLSVSSFFTSLYLWIITFLYVPSVTLFVLTLFFTGLFFSTAYISNLLNLDRKYFGGSAISGFLSSLVFVSIATLSLFVAFSLWKNSKSLWYFQKSSYEINTNGDISTSENYMLKAIETVPNDIYFRSLSQIELLKLNEVVKQDPNKIGREVIQQQFSDVLTNAITSGRAAKDLDPDNYLNWVSLGQVYEAVSNPALNIDGAYESAKLSYTEALNRNPKNPAILVLLARLNYTQGNLNEAKEYAGQAISQKNNYLDAYFILAQIEVGLKNLRGAIESVKSAIVIEPNNPAIFFQLGLLQYNIADHASAITTLEKAVSMTPDYANAKYFLGLSYEAVGRHDEAVAQFEDVLRTNPDNKDVFNIISTIKSGKSIFTNPDQTKTEDGKKLPIKENIQ